MCGFSEQLEYLRELPDGVFQGTLERGEVTRVLTRAARAISAIVAAWKPERATQCSAASRRRSRRSACWTSESLGIASKR